jgi:peptidoglycan/LPS O-acetylase OafA/YrhL
MPAPSPNTGHEKLAMKTKENSTLTYMRQLDGLRALAVLAVLIEHYVPKTYGIARVIPWGTLGVQLFFVLSGFLITGILLKCREISGTFQHPFFSLRQFYIRRFLRIFPLYYFVLCMVFLLNVANIRETIFWYMFYLCNIKFAIDGNWAGTLSHFWSLAVEEQFYLFWPFVILCSPRKILNHVVILAILVAPLIKWVMASRGMNDIAVAVLMPSNLDALGSGSLLALLETDRYRLPCLRHKDTYFRAITGLGVMGGS